MEPVAGVLCYDAGSRHAVLPVGLIQLIERAQTAQLIAVALQARILHRERSDLLAEGLVVRECRPHPFLVLEIRIDRAAHAVHTGLHRHEQVADRCPERTQLLVFDCRKSYHADAGYAEHNENQAVIRYFHNRPHSLKL